jgi:hypothetical protein
MTTDEAEIVRQDVTIQFFAKLSTKRAPSHTTSEAAEDCSGDCAQGETWRSGNSTDSSAEPAACKCRACALRRAANGANGCANFHSVSE